MKELLVVLLQSRCQQSGGAMRGGESSCRVPIDSQQGFVRASWKTPENHCRCLQRLHPCVAVIWGIGQSLQESMHGL